MIKSAHRKDALHFFDGSLSALWTGTTIFVGCMVTYINVNRRTILETSWYLLALPTIGELFYSNWMRKTGELINQIDDQWMPLKFEDIPLLIAIWLWNDKLSKFIWHLRRQEGYLSGVLPSVVDFTTVSSSVDGGKLPFTGCLKHQIPKLQIGVSYLQFLN